MAEVAGLVMGVAALSSLLSTCIELTEHISLARNVGADYEATYTKFLLLKSRLIASGKQLNAVFEEQTDQTSKDFWEQSGYPSARSLIAIKGLLENGHELEQKYGLRQEGEGENLLLELQSCRSSTVREIERSLHASAKQRQQRIQLRKRFVWAIRDKRAFDGLIENLAFHINELESLVLRVRSQTLQSMLPSLPEDMSDSASTLLDAAAAAPDLSTSRRAAIDQTGNSATSPGHLYLRNQIREHARVVQGDIGFGSGRGRQHLFEDNRISGEAQVVQGNVSQEVINNIWKD